MSAADHRGPGGMNEQAPLPVLLGEAGDLGVDRGIDLQTEEALRVPEEVAEQEGRKEREDEEVDGHQLEGRRADELTERCHGSYTPRPAPCGGEACRSPCRAWTEAARRA